MTKTLALLSKAFATRQVRKTFLSIAAVNPGKHITIDEPIGRHPMHRQRMRVLPDPHQKKSGGRRALPFVETVSFGGKLSLVQIQIANGRTHQFGAHPQDRHTPICGDDVHELEDLNKQLANKSH